MLLWPEAKYSTSPTEVKQKYMVRCVLKRETRCCLNYSAIFLSSKVIYEKRYMLKLLYFLLWPDLQGLRYDLKRSTRIPLYSKRPEDSFGLRPTVPLQLWAKWHGVVAAPPPMCVLGWGNSMCGRGVKSNFRGLNDFTRVINMAAYGLRTAMISALTVK